jgi:hypothetical protein
MQISDDYEKTRIIAPLLLRRGFSALFPGNHAETPPEVVTFLATTRDEFLFRIPTHYRLGSPIDVGFTGQ